MVNLTKNAADLLLALVGVEQNRIRGLRDDATVDAVELNKLVYEGRVARGESSERVSPRSTYRDIEAIKTSLAWCGANDYPLLPMAIVVDANYRFPESYLTKLVFGVQSREDALAKWSDIVESFVDVEPTKYESMRAALEKEVEKLTVRPVGRPHKSSVGEPSASTSSRSRSSSSAQSLRGSSVGSTKPKTASGLTSRSRSAGKSLSKTKRAASVSSPSMRVSVQKIDAESFGCEFDRFVKHVQENMLVDSVFDQDGAELAADAFSSEVFSNEYIDQVKEIQAATWQKWHDIMDSASWTEAMVGSGEIVARVQRTIDDPEAVWIDRDAPRIDIAKKLRRTLGVSDGIFKFEKAVFEFFVGDMACELFLSEMKALFTRQYAFVSHLLYLKDPQKYVPVSPAIFERSLKKLGVDLSLSGDCTWVNYSRFLSYLEDTRVLFAARGVSATIQDAAIFLGDIA